MKLPVFCANRLFGCYGKSGGSWLLCAEFTGVVSVVVICSDPCPSALLGLAFGDSFLVLQALLARVRASFSCRCHRRLPSVCAATPSLVLTKSATFLLLVFLRLFRGSPSYFSGIKLR